MDTREQLLTLRLKKPFTPFRIKLLDGRSVDVSEQVTFAVGETSIIVARPSRGGLHLRMEEIASIDVLEPIH